MLLAKRPVSGSTFAKRRRMWSSTGNNNRQQMCVRREETSNSRRKIWTSKLINKIDWIPGNQHKLLLIKTVMIHLAIVCIPYRMMTVAPCWVTDWA